MSDDACPCGGGSYDTCCGPYLERTALPPTAEATMRSRYTAFCRGDADHLWRTWHPRTRPASLGSLTPERWRGLRVLDVVAGQPGDENGVVEFVASHADGDLRERSRFRWRGGRWLYLDAAG